MRHSGIACHRVVQQLCCDVHQSVASTDTGARAAAMAGSHLSVLSYVLLLLS